MTFNALNVGDKVKIRDNAVADNRHRIGDIGIVVEVNSGSLNPYTVEIPTRGRGVYTRRELDRVPTFKVGDRVRYTAKHPDTRDTSMKGMIGTVRKLDSANNIRVFWDVTQYEQGHFPENLEVVSADVNTISTPQRFMKDERVEYTAGSGYYAPERIGKRGTVLVDQPVNGESVRVVFDGDLTSKGCLAPNLKRLDAKRGDALRATAKKLEQDASGIGDEIAKLSAKRVRMNNEVGTLRAAAAILDAA
ncbi:hypothetical protein AB0B57_22530 [Micromonospora sp. NPDC049101]|uniref:hypothetical protein n=1 Tax=Micromonospora sp. NPDC049101 TaxID=3155032 RepID=UPI0033E1D584